jgi:branched-chain amino acid transport system substrate-binding protein
LRSEKEEEVMRIPILAAAAAAALVLTACGGSPGPTSTTSSEHYKIGLIESLTGAYTALGSEDKLGAELAVAEINKAGGINGHQIDLQVEDDQTKPDQSVVAYNKLVGDSVLGVIGSSFSNSEFATVPLTNGKFPYISTAASDEIVLQGGKRGGAVMPNIFQPVPTAAQVGERLLQYMQAQGFKKVQLLRDTQNAFADSGTASMKDNASKYGVSFLDDLTFETATKDFTPQLSKVRTGAAQGVMVWGTGAPIPILVKQYKNAGITLPLMLSHAAANTLFTRAAGPDGEGVIIASSAAVVGPKLPDSFPAKKKILAMATAFQAANGHYPAEFAFNAYAAVHLMAEAIRKGGTKPTGIIDALNSMNLETGGGFFHMSKTNHYGLSIDWTTVDVVKSGDLVPTDFGMTQLSKVKSL